MHLHLTTWNITFLMVLLYNVRVFLYKLKYVLFLYKLKYVPILISDMNFLSKTKKRWSSQRFHLFSIILQKNYPVAPPNFLYFNPSVFLINSPNSKAISLNVETRVDKNSVDDNCTADDSAAF